MDDLFSRTVRLAHEKPALRHHLLPLLKEAQESDKNSKFEEGEDVSVSELPEELQKNVLDPPPSVKKLKDELKKKKKKKAAPEQKSRKQRWREFMQKDEATRKERKKNVKRKASLLFRAMMAACSSDALGEKLFPVIKANATKPLVKGKAASAGMKASVREQGLVASFMDLTVKDNPYPKGSELRRLWAEGLFEGV